MGGSTMPGSGWKESSLDPLVGPLQGKAGGWGVTWVSLSKDGAGTINREIGQCGFSVSSGACASPTAIHIQAPQIWICSYENNLQLEDMVWYLSFRNVPGSALEVIKAWTGPWVVDRALHEASNC